MFDGPGELQRDVRGRSEEGLQGVRGWLLFFCVLNTVIWPSVMLVIVASHLSRFSASGDGGSGIAQVIFLSDAAGVGLAAFGAYAGLRLWRRDPGAVPLTRIYLATEAIMQFVAIGFPYLVGLSPSVRGELLLPNIQGAVGTAVVVALWYAYFQRSRRVAATYDGAQ